MSDTKEILLIGNPNVGKSTLFNALTGMHQHTGNWTGKTVSSAKGEFSTKHRKYILYDLPGTYSLEARSAEEEVTASCVREEKHDAVIVVCDATNLEHSLNLVLQTLETANRVVVCVNLMDEAEKSGIKIDLGSLSDLLNTKTVAVTARKKKSLKELTSCLDEIFDSNEAGDRKTVEFDNSAERIKRAEYIASKCIVSAPDRNSRFGKADRVLTGKLLGFPIMFILFMFIFWLTISGANYPSELLAGLFGKIGNKLRDFMSILGVSESIISLFIDGVYGMTARVVSVMLPPMAIFFPLFTILEDLGYLPRIAYNLDRPFEKCRACGKQALTMCMGFGCNACGVTGARIIDSPRERLLAIITNSFVPCNGKFPTLIALISVLFIGSSSNGIIPSLVLTAIITLGIALTFAATKLLSATVLKGTPSSYILELPPFRKPQFAKIAVRSLLDRTVFVLGRALLSAAPAGLIVWLFANINIGGASILAHFSSFLDPFASLLGLDGVILAAFILGLPANETVMPIIIMAYMSLGTPVDSFSISELREILVTNGWTVTTAICTLVFTLLHWPCATTLLTIKKETGSAKWTLLSVLLPTAFGFLICFIIASISSLFV